MKSYAELSLFLTAALHGVDLKHGSTRQSVVLRFNQDARRLVQYLCTVVLILQSCATGPRVLTIPSTTETSRTVEYQPGDYEKMLAAITSAMVTELKLPAIHGSLIFYSSQSSFEAGVMQDAQEDLQRLRQQLGPRANQLNGETVLFGAKRSAVTSVALAMYKKVLVNEWRFSKTPRSEQLRILAHELTHLVQKEMVNYRLILFDQWLTEGFAEWVGYKVADTLAAESMANGRETVLGYIATARSYQTFPSLGQLAMNSEWTTWARTLGPPATYGQAFIAVDYLIERKGLAAVLEYFRLFAKINDHNRNFASAFGESIASFDGRFESHLEALLSKYSRGQKISTWKNLRTTSADTKIQHQIELD
jgi:hypothetical protein